MLEMQTFTLTFGDQAENHKGMQKIGTMALEGFGKGDLDHARLWMEEKGVECEMYHLNKLYPGCTPECDAPTDPAYILVARGGLRALLGGGSPDEFYEEQASLEKDTKAFMYGRVVNKKARHNLCFAEFEQEPDYAAGRGRIVPFKSVPLLDALRAALPQALGPKAEGLMVEGNYYYDPAKCFIGYHGDSERLKVVGVRVGAAFPFHYQWYLSGEPVGPRLEIVLGHGDVYIMSQKAVGTDWKRRVIPTLRHAAGTRKALKLEGPVAALDDILV